MEPGIISTRDSSLLWFFSTWSALSCLGKERANDYSRKKVGIGIVHLYSEKTSYRYGSDLRAYSDDRKIKRKKRKRIVAGLKISLA